VVSLTITRWPLYVITHASGTGTCTTSRNVTRRVRRRRAALVSRRHLHGALLLNDLASTASQPERELS
jgi:hypothetical protein